MEQPLVSIVTPSYNQAQFLEETILSVLNQDYPRIEYIIIDGGSTDHSADIIKKYANRLAWWVSEKDEGQTDAVNKGLAQCNGELVAYLNSDDVYEPGAVQQIVNAYLSYKDAAVYYGKCSVIDKKGNTLAPPQGSPVTHHHLVNHSMVPKIFQPACFFNNTLKLRKPLFREKHVIDYELLLWLGRQYPFHFIDRPVARYRVHDQTITSMNTLKIYEEKLRVQLEYGAGWIVKWRMFTLGIKKWLGIVK